MSPLDYYLAPWKKFVQFDGRSRRKEYWWFTLGNLVIQYAIMGIGMAMEIPALLMASTGFSFLALIPGIAAGVRRMHDVGKSGWFLLIPLYNLVLTLTDSQDGTNKYGPNPKTNEIEASDHLIV